MSGYIEAGYIIALGTIASYSVSVIRRETVARKRLDRPERSVDESPSPETGDR